MRTGSTKVLQRAVIKVADQIKAGDCCEILYSLFEESLSFVTKTQKRGCILLSLSEDESFLGGFSPHWALNKVCEFPPLFSFNLSDPLLCGTSSAKFVIWRDCMCRSCLRSLCAWKTLCFQEEQSALRSCCNWNAHSHFERDFFTNFLFFPPSLLLFMKKALRNRERKITYQINYKVSMSVH